MTRRALVLAGGGSRGSFQSGALSAIHDLKVEYHALYGSSVGSINGTQFHSGNIEGMINFWLQIKTRDLLKTSPLDYFNALKRGWLRDSSPLKSFLEKNIDFTALKNNPRQFWINATDYTNKKPFTREVKSLDSHEIVDVVLASASPPIYMPMVKYDGRYLCDSGLTNNFAITQAIEDGCDEIVLVLCTNPNLGIQKPDGLFDILGESFGLSMNTYLERETKCVNKVNQLIDSIKSNPRPKKINLIVIAPEQEFNFSFLDFDFKGIDRRQVIDAGYRQAMKVLNG
jgi:predicted acylesterase/phospholipase RssA